MNEQERDSLILTNDQFEKQVRYANIAIGSNFLNLGITEDATGDDELLPLHYAQA